MTVGLYVFLDVKRITSQEISTGIKRSLGQVRWCEKNCVDVFKTQVCRLGGTEIYIQT